MRLIVVGVVLAAAGISACGDSKVIAEKRGFVSQAMRDPASTQFRNETLHKSGWLCGELNSKNSYGAYVGFKRFISKDPVNAYVEGMSASGVGQPGHLQTTKALDLEIKALKEANRLIESGVLKIGSAQGWAKGQVFEMQWQEYCQ